MKKQFIIQVTAPCDCTEEQFKEWVDFCVGYSGSIEISNPLSHFNLECDYCYEG